MLVGEGELVVGEASTLGSASSEDDGDREMREGLEDGLA